MDPDCLRPAVEELLQTLIDGRASRISTSDSAEGLLDSCGEYALGINSDVVREVLSVLLFCDRCERDLNVTGAPYFIRDNDLREWLLALRKQDSSAISHLGLRQVRAHQIRQLSDMIAVVECQVSEVASRAGLSTIRGRDELDFYEALLMELPSGVQVSLIEHTQSPEVEIHIERSADINESLRQLLRIVAVAEEQVLWRSLEP